MIDKVTGYTVIAEVPPCAAAEYEAKKTALAEFVDRAMDSDPQVEMLTGGNPREMMYVNHRNHAEFMSNILRFSQFELLAGVLPWVYNSYHAHGFSYDYFPRALKNWKAAVCANLSPESQVPVLAVYEWMTGKHAEIIELAVKSPAPSQGADGRWLAVKTAFLSAVLAGETFKARNIAEAAVHGLEDMKGFYLEVLQPVMYEVGRCWQKGEVSVAQEHLATSIAGRVMASFYTRFMNRQPTRGSIIVTSAPNEFHELGARMVADFLEIDGWDTKFLGANTPVEELIKLLLASKPDMLGISVMMPFNLDKAAGLIDSVRSIPELSALKIMVGGGVLNLSPKIKDSVKADGWAGNAAEAVALANLWFGEK